MGIAARDVTKRFGDFTALEGITVEVETGSLTALLGPSGSGKSTLLRVIAGLERPDAGTVLLDGRDVTALPPQERGIGFVFQHYAAFKHMTVADNVAFGLTIRKRPKSEIRERVAELLALVQLSPFGDRYPAQLSGGQRQRMALARALAVEPSVLLLDEPFGALDARVRKELRVWLRRLHDESKVTTVIVTHDQEEAMEVAERIVVMNEGRIEQEGGPRELYESPASEFVMSFVGPVNRLDGALVRPHDVEVAIAAERSDRGGDGGARRPSRLRGSGRARPRRRHAALGAADEGPGRGARAGRGPDRLRQAGPDDRVRADKVGQRDVLEHAAQGRPQVEPDVAERLGRAGVLELVGPHPAHARDRPLDRADHVRDGDLLGRAREPVAALDAALARDEPRVAQVEEDVLEELRRDRLRSGDALALDGPLAGGDGELDRRPHRVVHLRRDAHQGSSVRGTPWATSRRPSRV